MKQTYLYYHCLAIFVLWNSQNQLEAANWKEFRNGGSSVAEGDFPLKWSHDSGINWQKETPGYGQSSPVIWGNHIYLTSVEGKQKEECLIFCMDLSTGEEKWMVRKPSSFTAPSNYRVSRAAPTPIIDENGVYAFFESGDLFFISHSGQVVWERSLTKEYGPIKNHHGLGSSPVQTSDSIVLNIEHNGPSYLLAIDKTNGKNQWKIDRPSGMSWTSPVIFQKEGQSQVIVSSQGSVTGYDCKSGKELWNLEGLSGNTVPSPTVVGDHLLVGSRMPDFSSGSQISRSNLCLKIPFEKSSCEVLWRAEKAISDYASPVLCDQCVYILNDKGVLYCLDYETGKRHYIKRIGTSCWSTPVVVNNRIYFFGKDGNATVIKAGSEFQLLSNNTIWNPESPPEPEFYQEAVGHSSSQSNGSFVSRLMKSDQNQDGKLSEDELPGRLKSSFKKLDLDSNGSLDKNELTEMEKEFRAKREGSRESSRDPIVYGVAASNGNFVVRTGTRVFSITGNQEQSER